MRQDNLLEGDSSSKYAHEIKNMRFNTMGDYVSNSWSVEQSTLLKSLKHKDSITANILMMSEGQDSLKDMIPVGQAVINDQWVLFCHTDNIELYKEFKDYIFKLWYEGNDLYIRCLFKGNLNFNTSKPLETVVFYETEDIQKVYWTDGVNQPRMINIVDEKFKDDTPSTDNHRIGSGFRPEYNSQFDFVKPVFLSESVSVQKIPGAAGQFPPGTVKYAITYYTKYGQESNIVWTSQLYYPMRGERGCSPDELSGDEFKITVKNISNRTKRLWDGIRLYSIVRTTENSTPVVRLVSTKDISRTVEFVDSNTGGIIVDPSILHYIGGRIITAETFDHKDNALFLGNIHLKRKTLKAVSDDEKEWNADSCKFILSNNVNKTLFVSNTSDYNVPLWYRNQLNKPLQERLANEFESPKVFKRGEWYRVGIQFQDDHGIWSEIYFLKDIEQTIAQKTYRFHNYAQFPVISYTLKKELIQKLFNAGYRKARLACCFPTNADRSVIAQGVIAPTVMNPKWASGHAPDRVSSWFFREQNLAGYYDDWYFKEPRNETSKIEVKDCVRINRDEIQSINYDYLHGLTNLHTDKFRRKKKGSLEDAELGLDLGNSRFYVKKDIMTFHSPDIEFDESLRTLDWRGLRFRVVGSVTSNVLIPKVYIDYKEQALDFLGNKGKGFVDTAKIRFGVTLDTNPIIDTNEYLVRGYERVSYNGSTSGYTLANLKDPIYCYWEDIDVYASNGILRDGGGESQIDFMKYQYRVYPFQRKYLNNYMGDLEIPVAVNNSKDFTSLVKESSVITEKIWSTLRHAHYTRYYSYDKIFDKEIDDCQVFDSNEVIPIILKNGMTYYGNLDTIAPIETNKTFYTAIWNYEGLWRSGDNNRPKTTMGDDNDSQSNSGKKYTGLKIFQGSYVTDNIKKAAGEGPTWIGVSSDPIPMRYKSTAHCVLSFNEVLDTDTIAPTLLVGELYREVGQEQLFGGYTEEALKYNSYVPCSKTYPLFKTVRRSSLEYDDYIKEDIVILHTEGDTYYMRYDHLKTYPFAPEDINQIVDIYSFMCESRINLDGRYDRNRNLIDNTNITNTNFNLINLSYTQTDNFFTYKVLDDDLTKLDTFTNQITWTKVKRAGEDVDAWTNITLANIADADGSYGVISKIINNHDKLLLFQDNAISLIGYNEKTTISTGNNIPLEIANSGKFTGFSYLTNKIGCQNKWSICKGKSSLMFIDNKRRELLELGEEFKPLSVLNGFEAFFITNIKNNPTKWNPADFCTTSQGADFVSYYDTLSKDTYYVNKDYCLAYNELTGSFTSFYDYNMIPYMANISNHLLMTKCGGSLQVYAAREGVKGSFNSYSNFFGTSMPYWMTLLVDGGKEFKVYDKVFNTIEYSGDLFDEYKPVITTTSHYPNYTTNMVHMPLFTDIAAFNSFQEYKDFKIDGRYLPKNHSGDTSTSVNRTSYMEYPWEAERKFNKWRVVIPRASYTDKDGILKTSKDRIRSTFTYIKLTNNETNRKLDIKRPIGYYDSDGSVNHGTANHRALFHDFIVYFDIR